MNHAENVQIMKDALQLGLITNEMNGRYVMNMSSHSTADHLWIYATLGEEKLLVYYKTNWCSSSYEFNERDKIIGFQCEGPWNEELRAYFEEVKNLLAEHKEAVEDEKHEEVAEEEILKAEKLARFTQAYSASPK